MPSPQRPSYGIRSVDSALILLQILRDQGAVRISEAADQLGVAPSTVHRLMQMLIYRGFATQDDSRVYRPGPGLSASVSEVSPHQHMKNIARPLLGMLAQKVGETVNLEVRVGTTVRFIITVESPISEIQVGDRQGAVFQASATSGGLALLSLLPEKELAQLYRSGVAKTLGVYLDQEQFGTFQRSLNVVREIGFAVNKQRSESGVVALGRVVRSPEGEGVAAITIAAPLAREAVINDPEVRGFLLQVCQEVEAELQQRQ